MPVCTGDVACRVAKGQWRLTSKILQILFLHVGPGNMDSVVMNFCCPAMRGLCLSHGLYGWNQLASSLGVQGWEG